MNAQWRRRLAANVPTKPLTIVRDAVTGVVLLVSFYYVARKLGEEITSVSLSGMSVNWYLLATSIALASLCLAIGGWEWSVLLCSTGERLPLRKVMRVHMLSNPPKYIPGPGWQLLGKAYLSRQAGLSMPATVLSMAAELAIAALSASALALLLVPHVASTLDGPIRGLASHVSLPTIGVLYVLLVPLVFQRVLGSSLAQRVVHCKLHLTYPGALGLFLAEMCTWSLSGVGFFLLVASLCAVTISQLPLLVFASTVSVVAGLVAFSAPAGLGVREGVMTFLLSLWLPGPYPAIVAVLSRAVLVVAELLGFAVASRL